jgi:dynein heavy chain
MYTLMPMIYFMPKVDYIINENDYSCPFYKTSTRAGTLSTTGQSTNYVLSIEVPTLEESPDFWILRGTAFLS